MPPLASTARKLASIVRVASVRPIPKADAIEAASIGGWTCVVKKGEFKAGDLGIYLEIDSVPPDSPDFAWLWAPRDPSGGGGAPARPPAFRIRTLKLRGCLSQGLLLPTSKFASALSHVEEGADVTALLGVSKYEPICVPASFRALFPSHIPRTDEPRVQSIPAVLDELRGKPYVATVKMDGSSVTFCYLAPDASSPPLADGDAEFHVCSRNQSVVDAPGSAFWAAARRYKLADILCTPANRRYAVQGELVGPSIQGNPTGAASIDLFVFNIFDVNTQRNLSDERMRKFCAAHALQVVPIAFAGAAFDESIESLLQKAEGLYPLSKREREGIVVRPALTIPSHDDIDDDALTGPAGEGEGEGETASPATGGRLSFKAISNRFLLAEKD